MKFKKFLLVPILFIAYVYLWQSVLPSCLSQPVATQSPPSAGSPFEEIPIGESISVTVTRQYLFGMITLPAYFQSVGNIGHVHTYFFWFLLILFVIFVLWEIRIWGRKRYYREGESSGEEGFFGHLEQKLSIR